MKGVPKRELDSVRLAPGFKTKRKGVKFMKCEHIQDTAIPTAKTPAGKHLARCSKCKGGFCVEDQEFKNRAKEQKMGGNKDLDEAIHDVRVAQRSRRFYGNRNNQPWKKFNPKPRYDQ